MEYDIYHDESQEAGYWHGILLVPRATRPQLLDVLRLIRSNTRYEHQLVLKRLDSTTGKIYRCVRSWLHFGIASLIQTLKGRRYPYYVGLDRPKPEFDFLVSSIGAKFVVFRVKAGHAQLVGLPDYAARIETTFRMGLKGVSSFLVRALTKFELRRSTSMGTDIISAGLIGDASSIVLARCVTISGSIRTPKSTTNPATITQRNINPTMIVNCCSSPTC